MATKKRISTILVIHVLSSAYLWLSVRRENGLSHNPSYMSLLSSAMNKVEFEPESSPL